MLLKGRTRWYFFYGEARNGAYAEGRHGPRNGDFEDDMVVWKIVLGVDGGLSGGLSLPFPEREAVGLCYEARELGDRAGVWNEDTFVIEADLGGRELFVRVVRRGAVGGGERGERGGRGDVCGHDGGGDERRDDEPEPSSLGGASGRVAGRSTIAKHRARSPAVTSLSLVCHRAVTRPSPLPLPAPPVHFPSHVTVSCRRIRSFGTLVAPPLALGSPPTALSAA